MKLKSTCSKLTLLAGLAGLTINATAPMVSASNHLSSPATAQDRGADIGDHWAFLDPNDNNYLVLILSTQDFIVSSEHFGMAIFDNNIRYHFEFSYDKDPAKVAAINVFYSPGLGRETAQTATIKLPGGQEFSAPTTIATQDYTSPTPVVTTDPATGVSFFGGVAADPFFLDDTGANRLIADATKNPGHPDKSLLGARGGRNTYAGFNTMITALRVPVSLLRNGHNVLGVYVATQRRVNQEVTTQGDVEGDGAWRTVDREGVPLVKNGLIPPPLKNAYNGVTPTGDAQGVFRDALIQSMTNFGTNAQYQAKILDTLQKHGDILRLDFRVPNSGAQGGNNPDGGFENMGGRRLTDDVVDATFTLLNNGVALGDNVPAPDKAPRDAFPFVADPYQPFMPGQDDHTQQ